MGEKSGSVTEFYNKRRAPLPQVDVFLIGGTSMSVYPAAGLYAHAPDGCDIYMIDPSENPASTVLGVKLIQKVATEGMIEFEKIMKKGDLA